MWPHGGVGAGGPGLTWGPGPGGGWDKQGWWYPVPLVHTLALPTIYETAVILLFLHC